MQCRCERRGQLEIGLFQNRRMCWRLRVCVSYGIKSETSRQPLCIGGVPRHRVARRPLCKSGRWVLCEGTVDRFEGSVGPRTLKPARSSSEIRLDRGKMDAWCELLVGEEKWVSLRKESSGKEEETRTQKPFVATLRVNESRPAELGQQPEASPAWGAATLTAKRRQGVLMPCD